MTASKGNSGPTFGFLTVREYDDHGFIGGYLLLNAAARPLEFHCSAPLKPTRPQEILYGSTLKPYLCGEVIAPALIGKAKSSPEFVCTDVESLLSASSHAKQPIVLIDRKPATASGDRQLRLDAAHAGPTGPKQLVRFELGNYRVCVASGHDADRDKVLVAWEPHRDELDLHEPFVRIEEAIDEAQRGATR